MPFGKKLGAALLFAVVIFLYQGLLNSTSAEGPPKPQKLNIPAISLETSVIPVVSQVLVLDGKRYRHWPVSNDAVSWHSTTPGNIVLSGHSDIYTQVFRDLHRLTVGDMIHVESGGQIHSYKITSIVEVQEVGVSISQRVNNGRYIMSKTDNRMTLVTCSRPGATHRLLIIAYPV